MQKGFWNHSGISWQDLKNEPSAEGHTPYDFLHGCCDVFAIILHEKYGYSLEYVEWLGLVHAYCVAKHDNREYYIDVRGVCSDYNTFFKEFDVFGVQGKAKVYRIDNKKDIPSQFLYSEKAWQDMSDYRKAAENIISRYDYYALNEPINNL